MQLNRLSLSNYRNYKSQSLELPAGAAILAGENAQGKTNLLESVFLLTGGRSWRAARRGDLVAFGQEKARIEADVFSRGREFHLELELPQSA